MAFYFSSFRKFYLAISALIIIGIATAYLLQKPSGSDAQVQDNNITVESRIEVVSGKDYNRVGEVDAGDTVKLMFLIKNNTNTEYKFATLQTGVNANLIHNIWNLRGTNSVSEENGSIVFKNIRIPAYSKNEISVEGTLNFFTSGSEQLSLSPQIVTESGSPIGIKVDNNHEDRSVEAWQGALPWWIYDPGVPTPTPTPSPSPSPSASPTPSITPSPSSSPSVTPTPSVSVTPTPSETPTPSPSVSPTPSASPTP